ncbi:glycosyltransferase family 87 protein [Anaeromyxobacter terrae]|uniref:glycosyltransferase family 87 protein n=1 Tax=Anaeromyxobacter terrae TaxID=2925406 RepID=UPI001F57B451|nr:glycosyltransferase family 87 protein [Anaeromyxobacter sp. SG22]
MEHTFDGEGTGGRGMRLSGIRRALHRPWHWAVAALILAELVVRGPVRALQESRDLTVHFGAARVWVEGGNPYDMRQVGDAFEAGGGPRETRPTREYMPSVYPPVTFAVEAPLALLGWRTAVAVFAAGALALVLLALSRFVRDAGLSGGRAAVAVLGSLALAPLHTGLGAGQVAIPSAAFLLLGWALRQERPAAAGVLLAIGTALKPPLAIPFLLACAVRPALPLVAVGTATLGGLFVAAVARLHAGGHDWVSDWLGLVREAAAPSGMNDVRPEAGGSIPMIHLEMLLWRITSSPAAITVLTLAATLPVAAFASWRLRVARDRRTELLALAALVVASLLATYHRTYDAFLLAVPLVAVLAAGDGLSRPLRYALGACFAPFLLPGAPTLHVLVSAGKVPAWLSGSAVWRILLVPHQIWALLALEVLLVVLLARHSAPAGARVAPARAER